MISRAGVTSFALPARSQADKARTEVRRRVGYPVTFLCTCTVGDRWSDEERLIIRGTCNILLILITNTIWARAPMGIFLVSPSEKTKYNKRKRALQRRVAL